MRISRPSLVPLRQGSPRGDLPKRAVLAALVLLNCSAFVSAGTLTYNRSNAQALADAAGGAGPHIAATTTSTLAFNVPSGFGEVLDVDVRVRLNHPNLRQLRIVLAAPNGTTVTLLENGVNASGNFILGTKSAGGANLEDTWFDADTQRPITDGNAPYSARFNAVLTDVEGRTPAQSSGTWELRITDYRAGDTGTLVSWSLRLRSADPAQVFTVTNLNDSGAGSLREAVSSANGNAGPNTIRLDAALSEGTINLTSGPIEIIDSDTTNTIVPDTVLDFGDARRVTVRNAGSGRVFTVSAGDVNIRNVTIADGIASGPEGGGGIFNAADLELESCTVRDNTAAYAEGVARGGGIRSIGALAVKRSTMSGNNADSGGAIYTSFNRTSVNASTLANNAARNAGTGSGGAIHVASGQLGVTRSTISSNIADGMGGGITVRPAADASLYHAIVAGNTAPAGPDVHGNFDFVIGSLIGNGSDATFDANNSSQIGTASEPIDPVLGPLANNGGSTDTMALGRGSPALDTGYCLPIHGPAPDDQRGVGAVDLLSVGTSSDFSYECDSGAFELNPAVFANISTRLPVETGENVLIAGFIVTTPDDGLTKKVIARGLGPSLQAAGITGTLDDPVLELYDSGGLLVSNDNWREAQEAEIEATTIPPPSGLESAIVRSLEPTSHTAILRGKNATTGIGLVELYDLAPSGQAVVANISTRGFVRTGDNVLIAGFILSGIDPARILLRAIGPSLRNSGVEQPLGNPFLELYDAEGTKIDENDDWQQQPTVHLINATGAAPSDPAEAAIIADLKAGAYTAVMRGANGGIGVGLIEAYNIR